MARLQLAVEGATMNTEQPTPPRWADRLLRWCLKPGDRLSIPGDLLEEYRDAKRPMLGALRADLWYVTQVFSVVSRLMWPGVAAMTVTTLLSLAIKLPWRYSLVQAPGVSVVDPIVCAWAGYYASRRTGLARTGMIAAAVTGLFAPGIFLSAAAMRDPALLLVPFAHPFVFVILLALSLIAVGFGIVIGACGAVLARCVPAAPRPTRLS
jgi:hypothetical protein